MSIYVRYPSSSGGLSEPVTLSQVLTVSSSLGIVFGASGTLKISGGALNWNNGAISSQGGFNITTIGQGFTNATTQTSAATISTFLKAYVSDAANAWGPTIGVGTTWAGTQWNTESLTRFTHSLDGTPVTPLHIKASGKLNYYNSASNAKDVCGTATLVGGTVTIATGSVVTGDKIFLQLNTPSGTLGTLSVPDASITSGTSFVINSSSAIDTSTVNWILHGKS